MTSVLFGDLVGFTPISEARDAEEVRELLSRYFAEARKVIERYGGTVEKFIGDAVMAVWGVPVAHEDDAERAVRAGLDLVAVVEGLGEEVGVPDMAARVGIVTGEVAVTVGAVGEGMVAGDAVNTAARVQAAASRGQVWVDEATRSLTAAAVAYDDAGEHLLKGKTEAVRLFPARAVVAAVGGAQRVDGLEAPFTGRDRELRLVKELFHATVEDGRPRMVAVSGTAGVGKSRLGWEFEKYIDAIRDRVRWHRGRALSYGDGVAFWALAEMVRSRLGISDGDPPAIVAQRLTAGLTELVPNIDEREPLRSRLAVLLGIDSREGTSFAREDLFAAWTSFFERVAAGGQCVALLFEDMQHADSGLLDYIDHLLESAHFPVFVLTFARPELAEARPRFGAGRRATPVYLEPLSETAMGQLVDGLVDGLPQAARDALTERAEGIPLYAVETVRALIDRDAVVPRDGRYVLADHTADDVGLRELGAPTSLQALIAARLDTLSPDERRAVGDASVHGMTFSRAALAETSPVADLDAVLATLVRKEIITIQSDPLSPERGQYRFVQALVRTVAYETLSRRDRKTRHLAVAAQIAAEPGDELAGVLARHYLDALDAAPNDPDSDQLRASALELLERAAARAEVLGSPEEALRHYIVALDRDPSAEVEARLREGAARTAGSAALREDALDNAARARELYERLGRDVDAGRVVGLIGGLLVDRSRLQEAIDLMTPVYEQLVDRPDASQALAPLTAELARALSYLGSWGESERYAKRALQLAESRQDWPQVIELLMRYGTLWVFQGMPTGGLAMLRSAVDLARQHHLLFEMVRPLGNVASFYNSRDLAVAEEAGREALALAQQVGARDRMTSVVANLAITFWHSGAWDEVERHETENHGQDLNADVLLALVETMIRRARGTMRSADVVRDFTDTPSDDPYVLAATAQLHAVAAAESGRFDEASRLAQSAVDEAFAAAGIDDDFALYWPVAVEYAVEGGDLVHAEKLLRVVADAAPGLVNPLVRAQYLRLRGVVAGAQGRVQDADEDLSRAADELRAFGAPYYLARALLARAELLHANGTPVVALQDEAREIFRSLDARPWVEAVDRLATSVAV
ncbi:MAG: adenylate/guanylate cyclase domain-containing protein [Actinomycetes bacterium]